MVSRLGALLFYVSRFPYVPKGGLIVWPDSPLSIHVLILAFRLGPPVCTIPACRALIISDRYLDLSLETSGVYICLSLARFFSLVIDFFCFYNIPIGKIYESPVYHCIGFYTITPYGVPKSFFLRAELQTRAWRVFFPESLRARVAYGKPYGSLLTCLFQIW